MDETSPTIPVKCLKCEKPLDSPIVCTECKTLFPPPRSADYFELLGLERKYAVDQDRLDAAFRGLARNIHPDRFTTQSSEMRTLSTQLSAEVNEAYRVLRDPVQRAAYMLESAGGPSSAQLRDVPGDLLAEVMMIREQLQEAQATAEQSAIDEIRDSLTKRRGVFLERIAQRADALASCSDAEKEEMRRWLNALRYVDNLLGELVVDPFADGTEVAHG